jgi:hypothetical protein
VIDVLLRLFLQREPVLPATSGVLCHRPPQLASAPLVMENVMRSSLGPIAF